MRNRILAMLMVAGVASAMTALPATAISNGTVDINLHPAVACIIGQGADGGWSGCGSGQLISPTVILTAGHTTNFFATQAVHTFVSFDPVVDPATSKLLPVARIVTDPLWDPKNFTNSDDYGVVILAKPVKGIAPLQLPTAGLLDSLKHGQSVRSLDVVGYGCSTVNGFDFTCDQTRRYASETVAAIDSKTIEILLNNPGNNGPTGVCSGDSGGPHLLPGTSITVGVTSSNRAGCWSTARAFRLDTPSARSFLGRFVTLP